MSSSRQWQVAVCALAAIVLGPSISQAADPVLNMAEAVRRTEAASPDIRVAAAELEAARARASQAGMLPNPEVRLDIENLAGSGPYAGLDGAETTLGLGQEIERGAKRRARAEVATADIRTAELHLAEVRADVVREAQDHYADTWAAQEQVKLAQETQARAADLARAAQTLVDAGREPPLRGLRAKTEAAKAQAALQVAQTKLASERAVLAEFWTEPVRGSVLEEPSGSSGATATGRGPLSVQIAESELANARARVDQERAAGTPNLTVEGGIRHFADSGDHALVVGFSAPLSLRNRNQGGTAAAQAEALGQEIRRNQALVAAAREEREARSGLAAAQTQIRVLEASILPEAEEALRLARLGYDAGRFSLIDVLDAQAAVTEARSEWIEARLARAKAQTALERALAQ